MYKACWTECPGRCLSTDAWVPDSVGLWDTKKWDQFYSLRGYQVYWERQAGRQVYSKGGCQLCTCSPVSHQEARCTQHLGGRGIREGFIEERIHEWSSDKWIQLPGEEMGWSFPSHPGSPPLLELVCGPRETVALAAWSHLVYYFSPYSSLNYAIKGKDYYTFSMSPFPSSIIRAYL